MTEDEVVGRHHRLNGLEQAVGDDRTMTKMGVNLKSFVLRCTL